MASLENTTLIQAVATVTEVSSDKTPFGLAQKYYRALPSLMFEAATQLGGNNNKDYFYSQLKTSPISAEKTLVGLIKTMDQFPNIRPQVAEAFLGKTLPGLLSIASLIPLDNEPSSLTLAIQTMAQQVSIGQMKFFSALCPPYHYKVTDHRKNYISHASGQFLPTIGARLPQVLNTLGNILKPVIDEGVGTEWTICTYSGSTGNIKDLVEVGEDILSNYRNSPNAIFEPLRSAFNELSYYVRNEFSKHGIYGSAFSIETEFSEGINDFIDQFQYKFPDAVAEISPGWGSLNVDIGPHRQKNAIDQFLQEKITASKDFLIHFIQEEVQYRELQHVVENNGILISAMKESLLYRSLVNYAKNTGSVLFGLEKTTNYMKRALTHLPGPVMTGKEFDVRDPNNPTRVRQPLNYPDGI